MKNQAPFLSLNSRDIVKGLLMAFIGAVVTGLISSLSATPPAFPLDWAAWKPIIIGGLVMALSYYSKNFLTNSSDQFLTKEAPKVDAPK